MTLKDALNAALDELSIVSELAEKIALFWERPERMPETTNGYWAAYGLHVDYPESTPAELLRVSRASGVIPTEHELEGWEQFWVELGLDSKSEVEQTAEEVKEDADNWANSSWHQPSLPGLEGV